MKAKTEKKKEPSLKSMFGGAEMDHPPDEPETDGDAKAEEEDMRTLGEAAMDAHASGDALAFAKAIKRISNPEDDDEEEPSEEAEEPAPIRAS